VLPAIVEVVGCVLVAEPHALEHAAVIVAVVALFDALNKVATVDVVQSVAAVVVVVADLVMVEVVVLDIQYIWQLHQLWEEGNSGLDHRILVE
jgi:uncharacterized membrane protein